MHGQPHITFVEDVFAVSQFSYVSHHVIFSVLFTFTSHLLFMLLTCSTHSSTQKVLETIFVLFQSFRLYHLRTFPQLGITLVDIPMLKCTTELIQHYNIPRTMKVTINFIKPSNYTYKYVYIILTFRHRNYFLNFSTPCI